jgi:copper transport protein
VLGATGLYSAGRQIASADALILTSYGRALIVKTLLFGVVLAAGFLNARRLGLLPSWARLSRSLRRSRQEARSLSRLPVAVVVEVSVAALVFGAVAVMISVPPARGPRFAPAGGPVVDSLSAEANDMLVNIAVKPNRPGENLVTVGAQSIRRPPPVEIRAVDLRVEPADGKGSAITAAMRQTEPGRFLLGGLRLDVPGNWRMTALVHRVGIEDTMATFDWKIPTGTNRPAAVLSDRPLATPLTVAAAILGIAMLALGATLWLYRRPIGLLLARPPRMEEAMAKFPEN